MCLLVVCGMGSTTVRRGRDLRQGLARAGKSHAHTAHTRSEIDISDLGKRAQLRAKASCSPLGSRSCNRPKPVAEVDVGHWAPLSAGQFWLANCRCMFGCAASLFPVGSLSVHCCCPRRTSGSKPNGGSCGYASFCFPPLPPSSAALLCSGATGVGGWMVGRRPNNAEREKQTG